MGRPKGSKNKYGTWLGNRLSVYLNEDALFLLWREINDRSKLDKENANLRNPPKDLTIGRLISACVYYVIDNNKLGDLPYLARFPIYRDDY